MLDRLDLKFPEYVPSEHERKWEAMLEDKFNKCSDECFLKRDPLWRKFVYNVLKFGYWKLRVLRIWSNRYWYRRKIREAFGFAGHRSLG